MSLIDWKSTDIFKILQRQVMDYNPAYVLKDKCVAGQAAPAAPSENDCYYYTGDNTATVFGKSTPPRAFLVFTNVWNVLTLSDLAKLQADLDANGKKLTNLPAATSPSEPMRKQEFDNHTNETIADVFNITAKIPLASGQYYTLISAVNAIPDRFKNLGLEITFEASQGIWVKYKFTGPIESFYLIKNWISPDKMNIEEDISGELTVYSSLSAGATLSGKVLTIPSGSTGYGSRIGYNIPSTYRNLRFRIISNIAIPGCSVFVSDTVGTHFTSIASSVLTSAKADGTFHYEGEVIVPGTSAEILMIQRGFTDIVSADSTIQFDLICAKDTLDKKITDIESRITSTESQITSAETKITTNEVKISGIETPTLELKTATAIGGEVFNGGISITNGITIPVGSTGNGSYCSFRKTPIDVSKYYINQLLRFKFDLAITNYSAFVGTIDVRNQRYNGDTYVSSLPADSVTSTFTVNGTTKTITFTVERRIIQTDLDNLYNYKTLINFYNNTPVSSEVSISFSNIKIWEQIQIVSEFVADRVRLIALEGNASKITTIDSEINKITATTLDLKIADVLGGEAFLGANITTNGITIPVGSTGNGSYCSLRKTPIDVSKYYIDQLLRFKFDLVITNYASYLGSIDVQNQRYIGNSFVASLAADSVTSSFVISGTTKTISYIVDRRVTQADLDNSYNYKAFVRFYNTTPVDSVVSMTFSTIKILEQIQPLSEFVADRVRLTALEAINTGNRLIKIENEITASKTDPSIFSIGECLGGSSALPSGFKIPIGSTGYQTYFYVKPTIQAFDSNSFAGQVITFIIPVVITNYLQLSLSAIPTGPRIRKLQGSTIITSSAIVNSSSFVDSINGTTLTRTFTCTYLVSQTDIDNSYWHFAWLMFINNNLVTSEVSVTTTGFSISHTTSIQKTLAVQSSQILTILNGVTVTVLTAKRTGIAGVDANFVGRRAIQDAIDSITDASVTKQYLIKATGIFEAIIPANFDKGDQTGGGQKHFIEGKSYVHLQGKGKDECVIVGRLPNNLGSSFGYNLYNVVMWNANSNIDYLTVIGENVRYSIHIDGGQLNCKNFVQYLRNLRLYCKNTGDALNWGSWRSLGVGMSDGQTLNVEDCEIESKQPIYFHTNKNFENPCKVIFKRAHLIQPDSLFEESIALQPLGSGRRDQFIMDNCNVDGGYLSINDSPWIPEELSNQVADHSEIDATLTSMDPIPVTIACASRGLKITSKSTGSGSTIVFDKTSTAFDLIIGDSTQNIEFINKYGRKEVNGYQLRSGGLTTGGWACGGKDIALHAIGISSNKYIGALGKRLGDCSSINKVLTVIVDGVSYDITFDKNYNGTNDLTAPNYTNIQIIAEITAVIGSVATVSEFDISGEYFPNFRGVKTLINADVVEVSPGMGIIFLSAKTFRLALNSDGKIDGIVLDYGTVGDKCRIMTRGEIWSQNHGGRFCTKETDSVSRSVGATLGISSTPGVFETSATPVLLRVSRANVLRII